MNIIMKFTGMTLDAERSLYGLRDAEVVRCVFDGPADGESAMKESRNLSVRRCEFRLRYPLWHTENTELKNCKMYETCRAPLWYGKKLSLTDCTLTCPKALRECDDVTFVTTKVESAEFGWNCRGVRADRLDLTSEYAFFGSSGLDMEGLELKGKYSFQYIKDSEFRNCRMNTKDAFWHASNVTVYDSDIDGEYIGWYSDNLRFVNCKIKGTQPFCYCNNLVLENCELDGDLAFENSDVHVNMPRWDFRSVKNPRSGEILCYRINNLILTTDSQTTCKIKIRNDDIFA